MSRVGVVLSCAAAALTIVPLYVFARGALWRGEHMLRLYEPATPLGTFVRISPTCEFVYSTLHDVAVASVCVLLLASLAERRSGRLGARAALYAIMILVPGITASVAFEREFESIYSIASRATALIAGTTITTFLTLRKFTVSTLL